MTDREQQIMELLRQDPMLPQGEIARRLGITRSSVGVHLANLSKKGYILGKGYVLAEQTERYVVGIGAANVDLMGRSREPLVMEDSNPGFISMSVGGVTHNICENAARMGAAVKLVTAIGDDVYGEKIRRECEAAGIDTSNFMVAEGEKLTALFPPGKAPPAAKLRNPVAAVEELSEDLFRGRCRLLPYQAVGVECGMLLALRLDDVRVGMEDYGGILVALSPTRISDGGGYSALIGA